MTSALLVPSIAPDLETAGTVLASYALLRLAALPYENLQSLTPPRTRALVLEVLAARDEMEALRPGIEDDLYALVPQLPERAKRSAAVALRRDVHNGRATTVPEAVVAELAGQAPAATAKAIRSWQQAQMRAAATHLAAEETLTEELATHLRPALRRALGDGLFSGALALASPSVQLALTRETRLPELPRATKPERTLLGYLMRATVKTSPFSTFMQVAPLPLAPGAPELPDLGEVIRLHRATLNRGSLSRLHQAAMDCWGEAAGARFRLNTTLRRRGETRVEAMTAQNVVLLGRPWRQERVARFQFHPRVIQVLLDLPPELSIPELLERLLTAGLAEGEARQLAAKLRERGFLWPLPVTDAFDPAPARRLQNFLREHVEPGFAALAAAVGEMEEAAAELARAGGDRRVELVDGIRHQERRARETLGIGGLEAYQNPVLEDSWLCGARGAIGGELPSLIAELGSFLGTEIAFSPEYLRLRRAFIAAYGKGGTCADVVGFLMQVGDRLVDLPEMGAQPRYEAPVMALPGTKLGITAQVQIVARSAAAAAAGDALVVVNRVYERLGWLAARFAAGDHPDQVALRQRIAEWLRQAHAPREPVDLLLNGHCNDLQAHPRLTARVFAWPGEPLLPERTGVVQAEETVLRHDPEHDLLQLEDGKGRPLSLVYLGSVMPTPSWGISYALSILSQPYQLLRPRLSPALADPGLDVVFKPRRTHGRLLLTRAAWWVRTRRVREVWLARTGVDRLLDVAADCRVHGIPHIFFARRRIEAHGPLLPSDLLDVSRKPLWVDVRNPFCLDLLERLVREGEWVSFSEALPGGDELWMEVEGQPHVSELQVELMITAAGKPPASL